MISNVNVPYNRQKSAVSDNPRKNNILTNNAVSYERQKSGFYTNNNGIKISQRKSMNSVGTSNLDSKSDLNLLHKSTKKNLMPKTQLRVIKVPGFCVDFVCKKNTLKIIKQVNENYKEIQFLLDIVHYLKSQNEINIMEKCFFTEEQRRILSYTYSFEADFKLEREGYDYMIKHEKNKFDEKDENETSQKSLLQLQ